MKTAPVDSNPYTIKKLRAEASREIKTMKTKIKLIHVQPPKIEMMEQATKEEKLVHKMH